MSGTNRRGLIMAADPRRAALECLCAVLAGDTLEAAFDTAAVDLDDRDRALARELASGTVRHFFSLREDVARFLTRPVAALDTLVLAQLILGAYQIRHTRVPAFAAVHASVDLARATRTRSAAGMVNAVLRRVASEPPAPPRDDESRYDHPQWLVDRLASHYPQWRELLQVNQTRAPMVIRVNLARGTRAAYADALAERGIRATVTAHSDVGLTIDPPIDARQLPDFFDGACTIQDEGAQLAGLWLDVMQGQRILDACAAPGNKTGHIIEQSAINVLLGLDTDQRRLRTAEENIRRLGDAQVTLRRADAKQPQTWWDGTAFQRILLDAPCSATGTLRRHPDIKLLREVADIPRLAEQQLALLHALWPTLAVDGLLVYCTCSILPEENQQVIAKFLDTHPDARVATPVVTYGVAVDNGRLLLPAVGGADGFFLARLRKTSAA